MFPSSSTEFSKNILAPLRRQHWLKAGDRIGIAVSGGADSVSLLRVMLELRGELGVVLSVVHFNHTLRGEESEADHAFVKNLALEQDLEFLDARGDVAHRAEERSLSIEAAAREARYEFFWALIDSKRLDKIATAHTLDDQAETVLLRLIRGTGTRGLGGIQPLLMGPSPEQTSRGSIIRPFLHTRRRDIETYLASVGQRWREDSSNSDLHHTRNRVRKTLIPLLEKDFTPEITERLADFAEIAQAEEAYWNQELRRLKPANPLERKALLNLPLALQRRLIRAAAPGSLPLEFRQVESILEVAAGLAGLPEVCNLADGWTFRRDGDFLAFTPPASQEGALEGRHGAIRGPSAEPLVLPVPGQIGVPATGRMFEALRILLVRPPAGYNPEHLYAPQALPSELIVRTWRFGDRFWPPHTKAPKKLKELFQAKKIAAELRAAWPVMVAERVDGEEVVWVQGFAAPSHLRPSPSDTEGILLQEIGLSGDVGLSPMLS